MIVKSFFNASKLVSGDAVAQVVPVPDHASDVDRLDRVALSAARILGQYVDSNQAIGVAWGSTMSAMSRHLVPKATHNTEIVQLNGAGNVRTTGILYASELLRRFGDAFGARPGWALTTLRSE